jgi:sensor histidine kinase YesM
LGLSNVERRLACQYGDHASLDIRSSPGRGTVVEIRVPVTAWIDEATMTLGGIE